MRFAAAAAVAFILLNPPKCPAASKITSWEVGKVVDADRKQELAGTAEHSATYGPTSRSTTSALYNAFEEYTIESDKFTYLSRERLRSERTKPALLTINGPVKFHVEGRKLVILDNEGKEHETVIVKQVSKTQNTESTLPDAAEGTSAARATDPLDNDAVVKMIVGGLKEATVIRVIAARPGNYVLLSDAVAALKAAGVPQSVITAMSDKMSTRR